MHPAQNDLSFFVTNRLVEVLGPKRREGLRILAKIIAVAIIWVSTSMAIHTFDLLHVVESEPPIANDMPGYLDETTAPGKSPASAIAHVGGINGR